MPTLLGTASGVVNNNGVSFNLSGVAVSTSYHLGDTNSLLWFNGQTAVPTRGNVAVALNGQNVFPSARGRGAGGAAWPTRLQSLNLSLSHSPNRHEQPRRPHVAQLRDGHVQRARVRGAGGGRSGID